MKGRRESVKPRMIGMIKPYTPNSRANMKKIKRKGKKGKQMGWIFVAAALAGLVIFACLVVASEEDKK